MSTDLRTGRPLPTWRVEVFRLTRTSRLLVLVAMFALLGLMQPAFTRYGAELMKAVGGTSGQVITLPPPTVPLALGAYLGQALQLGALVAAGMAASACALDARYALSVYYRTRVASPGPLLLTRLAVSYAGSLAGYLVGAACAWGETGALIGWPSVREIAGLLAAGACFLAFAVACGFVAVAYLRTPMAAIGACAALLMILVPLVGAIPLLRGWTPGALVSPETVLSGSVTELARPALVALVVAGGLVALGLARFTSARPRR